jgi:hypothetical protein
MRHRKQSMLARAFPVDPRIIVAHATDHNVLTKNDARAVFAFPVPLILLL